MATFEGRVQSGRVLLVWLAIMGNDQNIGSVSCTRVTVSESQLQKLTQQETN